MTETTKDYCVVQHSSGPQGGIVVRTRRDGSLAAPYADAHIIAVRKTERGAQAVADKLNAIIAEEAAKIRDACKDASTGVRAVLADIAEVHADGTRPEAP